MKITEFMKEIQENATTTISDLIGAKKYIASDKKVRIAKNVVDFSIEYDRGFVKFDSYKKHMAFIFEVIEAHTELHFADNWAEKVQEYDMLCEEDLLDSIIDTFRKDYEMSMEILNMVCGDMLAENSIEASVAKVATSISENLDVFVGALSDKIENLDVEKIIPKDWDLNKLQGLLNKFK
jgi:hypothetical protein